MIDTPWSYIKSTGAVSGGQYQGTGPFGKGLCSDFSLPHCHHHGPQGKDPYPAEGQPGCPSESSPAGPSKCDSTAKAPHDDFKKDKYSYNGKTQTASGEKAIQQMIMAGGPWWVSGIPMIVAPPSSLQKSAPHLYPLVPPLGHFCTVRWPSGNCLHGVLGLRAVHPRHLQARLWVSRWWACRAHGWLGCGEWREVLEDRELLEPATGFGMGSGLE